MMNKQKFKDSLVDEMLDMFDSYAETVPTGQVLGSTQQLCGSMNEYLSHIVLTCLFWL